MGFNEMPFTEEEIQNAIKLTISMNGFESCYIRPLVYLTDGGWNLTTNGKINIGIAAWEWPAYLGEKLWKKVFEPIFLHLLVIIRM
jgi:branched-chain amino acid aminotransferase